jgi:hypothetical protein
MSQFSTEDLIKYLYKEVSLSDKTLIENALDSNWALKEKFNVLKASSRRLEKEMVAPRPQSVAAILQYAQKSVTTV